MIYLVVFGLYGVNGILKEAVLHEDDACHKAARFAGVNRGFAGVYKGEREDVRKVLDNELWLGNLGYVASYKA